MNNSNNKIVKNIAKEENLRLMKVVSYPVGYRLDIIGFALFGFNDYKDAENILNKYNLQNGEIGMFRYKNTWEVCNYIGKCLNEIDILEELKEKNNIIICKSVEDFMNIFDNYSFNSIKNIIEDKEKPVPVSLFEIQRIILNRLKDDYVYVLEFVDFEECIVEIKNIDEFDFRIHRKKSMKYICDDEIREVGIFLKTKN